MPEGPWRLVILGVTGAGKTTLAQQASQRLGIPHLEADAFFWGPDWTPTPRDEFRARIRQAVAQESWVFDGNYSKVRDIVWPRATHLIWLDYPFPLVFRRLLVRTARRVFLGLELWQGNRESWRNALGRESILWWAIRTWRRRRREYPQLLAQPEHAHLTVFRHTSPQATQRWLQDLPRSLAELPEEQHNGPTRP